MKKLLLLTFILSTLCCSWLLAQEEEQNNWQITWDLLSPKKILNVTVAGKTNVTSLESRYFAGLWKACHAFRLLDNPECRCLPSVKKNMVFFFEDATMLTIQLVSSHWFYGVLYHEGQATQFYLKDPKNRLFEAVEEIMNPKPKPPEPPRDPMCSECEGMMFAMAMGKCSECDNPTSSIAFKLCVKCAQQQGKCQVCKKSLK